MKKQQDVRRLSLAEMTDAEVYATITKRIFQKGIPSSSMWKQWIVMDCKMQWSTEAC